MPTTRRRRTRNLVPGLTEFQRAWFLDAELPDETHDDNWWRIVTRHHDFGPDGEGRLWRDNRDVLLAEFVDEHPGRRPQAWWTYDAPRQPLGRWPSFFFDGKLETPRLRLGGVGTERHEVLGVIPRYSLGIPVEWVTAGDLRIWPSITAPPIDSADPPVFESQAVYLRRLGLLLPGEEARLRPVDLEPAAVEAPEDTPPPPLGLQGNYAGGRVGDWTVKSVNGDGRRPH